MSKKTISTTLNEDDILAVKRLAVIEDITPTAVIRRAVRAYVGSKNNKRKK